MSQEQTFRFAKHDKVQAMANVDASMGGNMCFRKKKKTMIVISTLKLYPNLRSMITIHTPLSHGINVLPKFPK